MKIDKTYIIILLSVVLMFLITYLGRKDHKKTAHKPVTIKLYYASWCGASRMFYPEWDRLTKIAKEQYDNVTTEKIDCESSKSNMMVCYKRDIKAYPTIIVYDGETVRQYKGRRKAEDIINFALN